MKKSHLFLSALLLSALPFGMANASQTMASNGNDIVAGGAFVVVDSGTKIYETACALGEKAKVMPFSAEAVSGQPLTASSKVVGAWDEETEDGWIVHAGEEGVVDDKAAAK